MDTEILTDTEAAELGLPAHVPGTKDPVEWSGPRLESVTIECSKCGNKISRTLSMPDGVSVAHQIKFTCKTCNGELSSSNHRRLTRQQREQRQTRRVSGRRGRPRKSPLNGQTAPESNEVEVLRPLSAALAGFAPVLGAGLAPSH